MERERERERERKREKNKKSFSKLVPFVEGNNNGVNVRPSVDKHHPTVVTWADVVREKVNDT